MTKLKLKLTKENLLILSLVLILSLILIYSLVLTPALGKADNGDFARMYKHFGLGDLGTTYSEQYDSYFHQFFKTNQIVFVPLIKNNWVVGCFIGQLAVLFNSLLNYYYPVIFDIRILGSLYSIFFILGVYFILKYDKLSNFSKLISGVFIILFFTDGIYISYFNSFFGEATTIAFLFLTIGSFLLLISKKEPLKRHFIFFFIASACFLTSKTQQLPLLLFILLIYIALFIFYQNHKKLILISSIFVVTLCITTFFSIDEYTNKNNIYQSVFAGILNDSETCDKDLEELGINPKFASNAGAGFYAKDLKYDPLGDEMLEEFYPNISLGKIIKFYVTHPTRMWENIKSAADNAYSFYPINYQNYVKGSNCEKKFVNTFRYNLLDNHLSMHRNIYIYIGFSFIYLTVLCLYFFNTKKKEVKLLCLLLLFLLAAGASQLVLPILGSGFSDVGKHLFLLNLAYDVLLGTVLVWICNLASKYIKYIKEKS
ncbi:MAG: hypothetical protein GX275_08240 [Clostridiales bacterium]|nr:hypothetical protein [Clostridiales bacterium]